MKLLVDTHVWLWMIAEPDRLSSDAASLLEDAENEILLSAASSWEIAIKYALGKLPLPAPPRQYVPDQVARTRVTAVPIEHLHALQVTALPPHHRDPFDRLLIATAQLGGLPLLTADPRFDAYDIDLIPAA